MKNTAEYTGLTPEHPIFKKALGYKRNLIVQQLVDAEFAGLTAAKVDGYFFTGADDYSFSFYERFMIDTSAIIKSKLQIRDYNNPLMVLDIGAGNFTFVNKMQQLHGNKVKMYGITAVDNFRKSNKILDEYHVIGNAENLSKVFTEQNFDIVVSRATFRHFVDSVGSLIEAFKKLKPGGILIIDELTIIGCEGHLGTIIAWMQDKGYAVTGQCSAQKIESFIIQKPLDQKLHALIIPVDYNFHTNENISYKVHPEILNKPSTYSMDYAFEIETLSNEADAINAELAEFTSLPDLFNDAKYKNLCLTQQLILILFVGKTLEQADFETEHNKIKDEARSNIYFARFVLNMICSLGGNFLYRLKDHTRSLCIPPDLQLACIKVAARYEIELRMKIHNVLVNLNHMHIPVDHGLLQLHTMCDTNTKNDFLIFSEINSNNDDKKLRL